MNIVVYGGDVDSFPTYHFLLDYKGTGSMEYGLMFLKARGKWDYGRPPVMQIMGRWDLGGPPGVHLR